MIAVSTRAMVGAVAATPECSQAQNLGHSEECLFDTTLWLDTTLGLRKNIIVEFKVGVL